MRPSFYEYAKVHWLAYVTGLVPPLVVFGLAFFVTNIGWRVIPALLFVELLMFFLVTYPMYREWKSLGD